MKLSNNLFIFIILIKKIFTTNTIFDSKDVTTCMSILPLKPQDCLSITFSSFICCNFIMSNPDTANLCVAMPFAAEGQYGNVTTTLPVDIELSGYYTCSAHYFKLQGIYFILIFILLL
jgi:hypothetical protein